jgi:ParB family transcriptional regulator, chromosome partitioning protein
VITKKPPRLGRGLDALLGVDYNLQEKEELKQLPLDVLQRGKYQPRTHMDKHALEELAASIKSQGVVQPIVVRSLTGGNYEIIAGERRWRAAQIAGLAAIPAVIRRVPDEAAIAIALIENIQRENLNPVEEAGALQRLIDEFGMTHQRVADAVGRSRAAVTNLLRLLSLNGELRGLLESGRMDMGHARALLALDGARQVQAARDVVERRLSVRETEEMVRRILERGSTRKSKRSNDPDIRALQQRLAEKLGAKVRIRHGRGGKGQVTIFYQSLDELDGILHRIR